MSAAFARLMFFCHDQNQACQRRTQAECRNDSANEDEDGILAYVMVDQSYDALLVHNG